MALSLIVAVLGLGWWQEGPGSAGIFEDITNEAGIRWKHCGGESEDRFLIEASSGGVAFADFDNDGLLDIYFVNGGETPRGPCPEPVRNALYHNVGNGKFVDVAKKSGVDRVPFFGMGAAVADYDNDGFQDLFVTGYPSSTLFHNNGDGTFTDVTGKAGVRNSGEWAASAAWFDYNRDGLLDLFVTNYASLSFQASPHCEYEGTPVYCLQTAYPGRASKLYRNNGDGTFTDVSGPSGIQQYVGRAFGVVAIDANDDGWPDLFVARDASPNLLLINQRDGTFRDFALVADVAYNLDGKERAGMGVDAGDVDGDGRPDFVVTNFNGEYHALYLGAASFPYQEWTRQSGLAAFTWPYVGWGVHFLDYDNDGALDLMIVNGHINPIVGKIQADAPYYSPPLLLSNNGKGVFQNLGPKAGTAFRKAYLARGLAVGDFDNDGDTDLVFVSLNDKPTLLANRVGQNATWIGFELKGTRSNRDAIGSRLTVRAGGHRLVRWITGGSSFLSSHDKRVLVGLGKASHERLQVEIRWPSGLVQTVSGLQPNRYHSIVEGR